MALSTVTAASVLFGSFDASPWTGQVEDTPGEVTVKECPNFAGGGFMHRRAGLKMGEIGLTGYGDFATDGFSTFLNTAGIGSQHALSISTPGTAAGDAAMVARGLLTQHLTGLTIDDIPATRTRLATDSGFAHGKLAAPLASRTTSGLTGTAVALTGPTASQRLWASLHVTAAAGTNLVVKVQSDDNSGFTSATDRITFSTVSAVGWQFSSVAGDLSTETYWRVVATIASSTFTFACAFGVA